MSATFSIPEALVQCRTQMHGDDGVAWLARLPDVLADCARRWSLSVAAPFPQRSCNYVAPATRADGSAVVLKVCYPDREFYTEAEALRLYDGRGCARLLAADLEQGAMLVERVLPGSPLSEVHDEEEVADVAAAVMRRLWRPAPPAHNFPTVDDWVMGMVRKGPALKASAPHFPWRLVDQALGLYRQLAPTAVDAVLLHGDLHQGNILSAEREPWLAIDPKGIVGPPIWETGPLFLNAIEDDTPDDEARGILDRVAVRLARSLGFDLGEIRAWGVVRGVLAAFWTIEDGGQEWDWSLRVARLLEE
ncbi:MAG: aminoglycoside phosphotransferase family protein [Anaerolineae bacterium]